MTFQTQACLPRLLTKYKESQSCPAAQLSLSYSSIAHICCKIYTQLNKHWDWQVMYIRLISNISNTCISYTTEVRTAKSFYLGRQPEECDYNFRAHKVWTLIFQAVQQYLFAWQVPSDAPAPATLPLRREANATKEGYITAPRAQLAMFVAQQAAVMHTWSYIAATNVQSHLRFFTNDELGRQTLDDLIAGTFAQWSRTIYVWDKTNSHLQRTWLGQKGKKNPHVGNLATWFQGQGWCNIHILLFGLALGTQEQKCSTLYYPKRRS